MKRAFLALWLAGCDDDLSARDIQYPKPPSESAENFCVEVANQGQEVDQSCAPCPSNWNAVYQRCLARFFGQAAPADGGTD